MKKKVLLAFAAATVLGLCSCGGGTTSSTAKTSSSATATTSSTTTVSSKTTTSSTTTASSTTAASSATSSSTPVATVNKINEVVAEGNYTIKGVVVAVSANSILLDDTSGRIVYYEKGKCSAYVIGDYYKIVGAVTKAANYRYGNFQFVAGATLTQLDKANAPKIDATVAPYDAAAFKAWSDSMKAESATGWTDGTSVVKGIDIAKRPLVSLTCNVIVSGTYINGYMDTISDYDIGFTGTDAAIADLKAGTGKDFDVTGYLYEVVAQKHCYIFVTAYSAHVYAPTAVTISGEASVQATKTITLAAAVTPAKASQTVTWSSEATEIATVDAATGVVTGVKEGTAKIKATSTDAAVFAEKEITVTAAPASKVSTITVSAAGDVTSVDVAATLQMSAAVTPTDADKTVAWSSSDPDIAKIDAATGIVTGVSDGAVTITATAADGSGVTGTYALTIAATNLVAYSAIKTDSSTVCSFKGTIAVISGAYNIISDGTNAVVYYGTLTGFAKGDYVLAYGTWQAYKNAVESKKVTVVKDKTGTAPTIPTTPVAKTGAEYGTIAGLAIANSPTGQYITLSAAKLYADGTYTDMYVDGAGTAVFPKAADGFTLPDVGTWGTFNCWVAYTNTVIIDGFTADAEQTAAATAVTVTGANATTTVDTGATLQMSAVVAPYKADQTVTWSVANKDTAVTAALATIDAKGLLTAGATAGVVVVTATSSTAGVVGTLEITINKAKNYTEVGKYVLPAAAASDGNAFTDDATGHADALSYLNGTKTGVTNAVTITGTQVITSVTACSKVYPGKKGVFKFGSGSAVGSLALGLTSTDAITKIVVDVTAYNTNGGGAIILNDGSAISYTGNTGSITLESDTAITSLTIATTTTAFRSYLSGITFYKIAA